jgi:hypothetical protein
MTSWAARLLASVAVLAFLATSAPTYTTLYAQVAEPGSVQGVLNVVWGDAGPGVSADAQVLYTLVDADGRAISLQVDAGLLAPLGGITAVNGRRVVATGDWLPSAAADGRSSPLRVSRLELETLPDRRGAADLNPQAITGPQPWVNVLCKFADMTMAFPAQPSHYDDLMGSASPGMNHYWREASYGLINIDGTQVTQWYTLPHPWSYYVYNGIFDFTRATNDCVAAADDDVFFPNFVGINLIFNYDLNGFAYGGSWSIHVDGQWKVYRTTWMPPWAQNPAVFAHEMGHGFGLPHSSGPYNTAYDSSWDPLSDTYNNPPHDPLYGSVPVHTIAHHKDLLGWIPAARKLIVTPGSTQTVTLEPLAAAPSLSNSYQMIQVPLGVAKTAGGDWISYYTIEARQFAGYDTRIPSQAVVMHKVLLGRGDREAQVVDVDWNGNPDDDAARWLPGETFTNAGIGLTVRIDSVSATGFVLTITLDAPTKLTGDHNGDGRTDLLWRHTAGTAAIWLMDSGQATDGGGFGTVAPKWEIVGDGDFNGDNKADLLWRDDSGALVVWFMDGTQTLGGGVIATVDPAWQVVGTGDHNDDGRSDILWRHASGTVTIWLMNGGQAERSSVVATVDPSWQVIGSGDHNGDGRADILWRHTSGQVAVWLMSGTQMIGGGVFASIDPSWHGAGTGDFDGDGHADILWRHSTGAVAIWFMRSGLLVGGGVFSVVDPAWQIVGRGDYAGDGTADLLWQHASGSVAMWFMDGLRALCGSGVTRMDVAWRIVDSGQPASVP